jgi:NADH-quinone oxidoreductase subunit G
MQKGREADLTAAIAAARALIDAAKRPVALVSSWGSNEELAAFSAALGTRFRALVKPDRLAEPGERIEDDILIRADKNPNTRAAVALFGDAPVAFDEGTDLVLVWGDGFDFVRLPHHAKTILLGAFVAPENGHADVFFPVSVQSERAGHYTNFEGKVSAFSPCFPRPPTVVDAETLFARLGTPVAARSGAAA